MASSVTATRRSSTPALRVLSGSARRGAIGNFWFVEGEVQNVCATAFDRIEAVVRVFNGAGTLVATDSALLNRALLESGAVARFSVVTHDRSDLTAFEIQFRTADGTLLDTADKGRRPFHGSSAGGGRAAGVSQER